MDNSMGESGHFRMQRVVEETGLTADTLRAWEDRYGLPLPQRSKAGHRLYSLRDIEIVKWMLDRKSEGIRPNQAAKLYQELVQQGEDPLLVDFAPASGAMQERRLEEYRRHWLEACLNFDEVGAGLTLAQAFSEFPPVKVLTSVLMDGMQEIGRGWKEGRISVAQEHFASQITSQKLDQLRASLPRAVSEKTILVTCPPGELHSLPALLMAYLSQQSGWQTIYLGSDLPEAELISVLSSKRIDAAVLTGSRLKSAPAMLKMMENLIDRGIPVGYGGYIYSHNSYLRDFMPGIYLGDSIEGAVRQLPTLLMNPTQGSSKATARKKEFLGALQRQKSQVTSVHEKALGFTPGELSILDDLCINFLDSVEASAVFGEFDLLIPELDWLTDYFQANQHLDFSLQDFIVGFKKALEVVVGQSAGELIAWLDQQL